MYNKLFTKILRSSVWLEPTPTRIVWIACIAAMDEKSFVQCASLGNMAHMARVTEEEAQVALATLEAPDPNSSDEDYEGRRLERVPGGWIVINGDKYRELVTKAVAQEQTRIRVARHRAKKAAGNVQPLQVAKRNGKPLNVTPSDTDTEAEKNLQKTVDARPKTPPDPRVKEFLTWFQEEYARRRNGAVFLVNWAKDAATVKRLLTAAELDRLKLYAGILLSEKTDDPFIMDSDRGIGVLAARFNWLADRLAAWEAKRGRQVQD